MKKLFVLSVILILVVPLIFLLTSCSEEDPVQTPTTGTIQGKVTNSTGDTVIIGATVQTNPPTSSVTTNSSGDYSIPDVSPGQYSVTAMKGGYNPTTVTITVSAGKTTTANIPLNLSTITTGLIAYYPFSDDANDASGNGYNGIAYNTVSGSDRFGNQNKAFQFNGTNSKVTVNGFPVLRDNFSYSCWIKIIGNNWNSNIQSFGILGTGPSNHTWDFGYHNVLRQWDLWDSTPDSWYTDYSSYATNNLLDWSYVTVVYTASSKSFYVNGVLLNSKSVVLPLPFKGDNTLVIGNFQGTVPNEQAVNGFIDDIRIYNRALIDSEIQALYHEGGWTGTIDQGLIAYYPFNGNANDESGNGNNGILRGDYQVVTGIKNEALRFIAHGSTDSLGGHVLLPNFHFKSMSSFSYSLWIKEESLVDAENYISFRDDLFGVPYAGISHSPASNIIEFQVGVTSTNPALTAPFSPSYTNNFVHYCLVYTNGILKGYINGSFIGQKTQTAIVDGIYSAIARHYFSNQTSTRFTGVVDDVRIYDRALTENEIQALYQEGV